MTPPDLVKRVDGKVAPLSIPAEYAAAQALSLSPEASGKLQAFMAERGAKADATIVAAATQAAQLWAQINRVDTLDLTGMSGLPQLSRAFTLAPQPMDALSASGALSPAQMEAVRSANTAFRQAISEDVKAESGTDVNKLVLLASRQQVRLSNLEFTGAMNRMLDAAAADWANIATVTAWPNEGDLKSAMEGSDAGAKRTTLAAAIAGLQPELATKLLTKYARASTGK